MPNNATDLEVLLDYLKGSRGFDFTGYKRATLERRITKRLQSVGCNDFADYLDYLEVHPDEFGQLFNTVLINVTSFFRDGSTWEYLAKSVVPRLIERFGMTSRPKCWLIQRLSAQTLIFGTSEITASPPHMSP